jgi:hypothetical protein
MVRTGRFPCRASASAGRLPAAAWLGLLGLLTWLSGCAVPPVRLPDSAPARVIGDVAAVRRCVGDLLVDYGARDLSLAVEPVATAPTDAGAKDMLGAALSEIGQRSGEVRVVAAGAAAADAPKYLLRAAVRSTSAAVDLDLTLLTARDMSVVPGTASTNTAALRDGRVALRKFGAQFELANTQALRTLADVATIELVGRVARLPYWTCFGADPADAPVAAEIQDWYDTMAAHPAELIGYFQHQLRRRGLYDGALDGRVDAALKDAVARYREALGLTREPKLSLDFFRAYLGADHRALTVRLAGSPAAVATPVAPPLALASISLPAATELPLELRITAANEGRRLARGEALRLTITPSRDAFVYCFHQDENRRIRRFFPNRFQRDAHVSVEAGLQLPGAMRFEIVMNARAVPETVACFATDSDVLARLPDGLGGADFSPLPVPTLERLRSAFAAAVPGPLAQQSFEMRAR